MRPRRTLGKDFIPVSEVFHEGKWISNEEYLKIVYGEDLSL